MRVAKMYLNSNNANILVVGDKDAVAAKIAKYDGNKVVDFYDNYGNPVEAPQAVSEDLKVEDVIENYIDAIGGKAALDKVKTIETNLTLSMMGQSLDATILQKAPNKSKLTISMLGQVFQEQIFDGTNGAVVQQGQTMKMEGKDLQGLAEQSMMFPELAYTTNDYELTLSGIEKVEGTDAYKVVVIAPSGNKVTEYYDINSGLKIRSIGVLESPQGNITQTTDYSDYKAAGGVMIPHTLNQATGPQNLKMTVKDIKVNGGIDDAAFEIK
jgi:hypothetical protein